MTQKWKFTFFLVAFLNLSSRFATACCSDVETQSAYDQSVKKLIEWKAKNETDVMDLKHETSLSGPGAGAKCAVLMLPGLYESPHYTSTLNQQFVGRGCNVLSVLLSSHWRQSDPYMKNPKAENWRKDAEETFQIAKGLGKDLHVFGFSTGGLLAFDLALRHPNEIKSLLLFAPAMDLTVGTLVASRVGTSFGILPSESCAKSPKRMSCWLPQLFSSHLVASLKEGLALSPEAGIEVRRLEGLIANDKSLDPGPVYQEKYGQKLSLSEQEKMTKFYEELKTPLFLVVVESDHVINANFLIRGFRKMRQTRKLLSFSDVSKVKHTSISKGEQNAFRHSPEHYNQYLDLVLGHLHQFMDLVEKAF